VDEVTLARGACYWQGQYYADNATWQLACNTCSCSEGVAACTQIWCGVGNCLATSLRAPDAVVCSPDQVGTCLWLRTYANGHEFEARLK